MNNLSTYILEKLKINKDSKAFDDKLINIILSVILDGEPDDNTLLIKKLSDWLEDNKIETIKFYVSNADKDLSEGKYGNLIIVDEKAIDTYINKMDDSNLEVVYMDQKYSIIARKESNHTDDAYLYICTPRKRLILVKD